MDDAQRSRPTSSRPGSILDFLVLIGVGIAVFSIAFMVLIFAARGIASHQPPPESLAPLHLSDCALPCWLGMTPGKTTFDEAIRRMSAAFPQSPPTITDGRIANLDTSFGQVLITADRDGIIHRITLPSFRLKGVVLGDIVGVLGMPTWVVGVNPTAIFYGCLTYEAVVSGGSVSGGWRQRLVIIDIQDIGFSCPVGQQ